MRIQRLATTALLALAVGLATAIALPSTAQAAVGNTFGVLPTGGQQPGKATRTDFIYEVRPGQSLQDSVSVVNLTKKTKYFRIYAADAYNTDGGGAFAVTRFGERNTEVGSWIQLPFDSVKVPAKSEANIAFTVKVPADATPGDHQGGIVAVDADVERPTGASVGVAIEQSIFTRVYARVAGPLTPGLDVEQVRMDRDGGRADIHYVLANTGNTRISSTTEVTVTGLFGREVATLPPRQIEALLPGSRVEVSVPWEGVPPLDLLTVTVSSGDATAGVSDSESTTVLAWRWWLLLVPVLLLLAAPAWRWWRRRPVASAPAIGRRRAGSRRSESSRSESDRLPVP